MKFQLDATIRAHKRIKGPYFYMVLDAGRIARQALPGQFVSVRVSDGFEPLLRRPFGVHGVKGTCLEILYQVVGEGTRLLSRKKAGDRLDIIGPLGTGFYYRAASAKSRPVMLVAGGMGVAPLVFLARRLKGRKGCVLIGAGTAEEILCEKEFKDAGFDVTIATDDGSRGFKGYVSELLGEALSKTDFRPSVIFACGPLPMLREVAETARRCRLAAQVSLEEHMSCGFGACLGCVVKTRQGFQRVCQEGPVFDAREIVWKEKGGR